ncbi:hypothetical protein DFH09DRAFT_1154739 [Mycena vulgaris]|nr:hypothetical protein DFH09DRAFT_1154739 [Mycena vulgaris]
MRISRPVVFLDAALTSDTLLSVFLVLLKLAGASHPHIASSSRRRSQCDYRLSLTRKHAHSSPPTVAHTCFSSLDINGHQFRCPNKRPHYFLFGRQDFRSRSRSSTSSVSFCAVIRGSGLWEAVLSRGPAVSVGMDGRGLRYLHVTRIRYTFHLFIHPPVSFPLTRDSNALLITGTPCLSCCSFCR